MLTDHVELLLNYPLMVYNDNLYTGSIYVEGDDYDVCVKQSDSGVFSVEPTEDLHEFHSDIHKIPLHNLKTIVSVLDEIKRIIQGKPHNEIVNKTQTHIFKKVLHDYVEFTKFYLHLNKCELSPDLSRIIISTLDEKSREHFLWIKMNYSEPWNVYQVEKSELPWDNNNTKPLGNLMGIYEQFQGYLERLQEFWDLMETIDGSCWVLDPVPVNKSHNYRRVVIGENLSAIITVDPFNLRACPDVKFLGPERIVEKFREKLNKNLLDWRETPSGVFQGILDLLGLEEFPKNNATSLVISKPIILREDDECSICFSYRLQEQDKLPEIVCGNSSCRHFYHVECLYEWFVSVGAKRIFNEVSGRCPNCDKVISCPIPNYQINKQ